MKSQDLTCLYNDIYISCYHLHTVTEEEGCLSNFILNHFNQLYSTIYLLFFADILEINKSYNDSLILYFNSLKIFRIFYSWWKIHQLYSTFLKKRKKSSASSSSVAFPVKVSQLLHFTGSETSGHKNV